MHNVFGAPRVAAVDCALLCAVDRERCAHFDHCIANAADDGVRAAFVEDVGDPTGQSADLGLT